MIRRKTGYHKPFYYLIGIFLVLSFGILWAGYGFYLHEKKSFTETVEDNLSSIAELKTSEIINWRKARMADAVSVSRNPILALYLKDFFANPSDETKRDLITKWLKARYESYGYRGAVLADESALRVISFPPDENITSIGEEMIKTAIKEKKPVFSDFHRYGGSGYIHIDIVAPILSEGAGNAIGAVLFRIMPEDYFYPFIQSWPAPSKTGETLLVRREGNEVVFLNELRHKKNTALVLRFPVDTPDLPAAMAVRGIKGPVEGRDYNGVRVFAAVRAIPDSPWYIVAKVSADEILGPLRAEALKIVVVVIILLVAAGSGLFSMGQWQLMKLQTIEHEGELRSLALEKHYDYLAKYANDSIVLSDRDKRIVQVNDRVLDVYGYSREEIIGMPVRMLREAGEREKLDSQIRGLDSGRSGVWETRHVKKDGTVFPVEVSTRVIEVEGEGFYQAIVRDISERKRSEEELRQSEERFRTIFEESPIGVVTTSPDLRFIQANSSFCEMTGYSEEELKSRTFGDITHPEHITVDLKHVRKLFSGELEVYRTEKRYIRKDKSIVWAHTMVTPVKNTEGKVAYVLAMVEDITGRKKADEKITLLSKVVEQSTEGIAVSDLSGKVIFANAAWAHIHGYEPQELIGQHLGIFHTPEQMSAVNAANRGLMEKGNFVGEIYHVRKDGAVFPMEMHNTLLRDEKGGPYAIIGTARDITERKAAEETLKESERKLKEAQRMAHLGYWHWDVRTGDVKWSEEVFNIFRLDPAKFTPRIDSIMALSPWPGEHERNEELIRRATKDHEGGVFEQRFLRPDGSDGYYYSTFQGNYDDDGRLVSIVGTVQDITERKLAEEALVRSERTLKTVFSTAPVCISLVEITERPDGAIDRVIKLANEGLAAITGYSISELEGKSPRFLFLENSEYVRVGREVYGDLKRCGRGTTDSKWKRKNGEVRDVYINAAAVDPRNLSLGVIFTATDITDRKRTEAALIVSEARFRELFNNANVGVCVYEPRDNGEDFIFKEFNPAAEKIEKIGREEVLGRSIMEIFPSVREFGIFDAMKRVLKTGAPESLPAKIYKDDRIAGWRENYICRLPSGELVTIYEDVTDKRKAEEELNRYREHLEEMVKERTDELESFSYSVSHDLRAPLRAIDGFSRILAEEFGGKLDQEGRRIIEVIVKSTKSMGQLIDDLLAFSRMGRREAQFDKMDMTGLAREVAEALVRENPGRNIDVKAGMLPEAFGDRSMMQIVLVNLLSNAVKFTRKKERSEIEIGCEEKALESVYYVRDNGVGFDMKYASKLFGVFQRLHSQEEFEGTGIGLALVKRIITKHGGKVWAEGEAGKGATFYFSLPKRSA